MFLACVVTLNSLHGWHVSKFAKKPNLYLIIPLDGLSSLQLGLTVRHAVNAALAMVRLKLVEIKHVQYCNVLQLQAMDH